RLCGARAALEADGRGPVARRGAGTPAPRRGGPPGRRAAHAGRGARLLVAAGHRARSPSLHAPRLLDRPARVAAREDRARLPRLPAVPAVRPVRDAAPARRAAAGTVAAPAAPDGGSGVDDRNE